MSKAAPALVVPEGPRLSYAELRQEARRAADAFAAYGLGRGDRIALVLPNGAELVGAVRAGTVA